MHGIRNLKDVLTTDYGLDLAAWLRQEGWRGPVIFVSGAGDIKERQAAASYDCSAFVPRADIPEHLARAVRALHARE